MSDYRIFKGTEFEGKTGAQLQQTVQQLKKNLIKKRNYYHQLRN